MKKRILKPLALVLGIIGFVGTVTPDAKAQIMFSTNCSSGSTECYWNVANSDCATPYWQWACAVIGK